MTAPTSITRGGSWLLERTEAASVLTPEQLSDEHRLIARTAEEFVAKEVLPSIERLENKDWELARRLLRTAGGLGLLAPDAPEEYGGAGMDKTASIVVSHHLSGSASFSASFGAQANLVIVPLLLFGTEDQKRRYLPGLISGERVGAYALSESGSGSDALGAKTRATRLPDGSFVLNGEKMWTTNGGFADLFIVFAKIDGEHFSAFIVERSSPGVSTGAEERKMGLHGSSTTPLVLQDAKVPAANLLGEPGRGHKVAFNVLNVGRLKLGAMCVGGAIGAIAEAARYAAARRQFGRPIAAFGAIRHKLGEMTVRTYAIESLLYRTSGLIDEAMAAAAPQPSADAAHALAVMEEFAVEASIAKVAGSETLEYVLDENVQVHGGNGFVKDYPAERHYRDARVNRIFEGTNEINRLLIPGLLIRRAVKGDLPLIPAARRLHDEILSGAPPAGSAEEGPMAAEMRAIDGFRKVALMLLGLGMERYGDQVSEQQEVLLSIADVAIAAFGAESALLRSIEAVRSDRPTAARQIDAARVYLNDAAPRIEFAARQSLAAMSEGDTLRVQLAALRRFMKLMPIDTFSLRRQLADETVSRGRYLFR